MPLMPASEDIIIRYAISSPRQAYVTYVPLETDVLEGDILVVDSKEYIIRAVQPWPEYTFLEVIVEMVEGT